MLIAVSMLMPMPISTLLAPLVTGLDMRLQACFQVSHSAVLEGQRQETAHIAVCKLTAGFIMGCQELCKGQQFIDLAIAKDMLRRDRGFCWRGTNEGSPMQSTNCLDGISVPVAAQRVLCRQP